MAFKIQSEDEQRAARLAQDADGITVEEGDGEKYNEVTRNIVDLSCKSNVLATQSWVSKILRRFCAWGQVFHTGVVHAAARICTDVLESSEVRSSKVIGDTIVLQNDQGMMVRLTVGPTGKLVVTEGICDVYVYPGDSTMVREFLYRKAEMVNEFAGLTPQQTLLNFVPFVSDKVVDKNGKKCFWLCTADGVNKTIDKTLLFNFPPAKVAESVVLLDSNLEVVKTFPLPPDANIRQLTVNMPSFRDKTTQRIKRVALPAPTPLWSGTSDVFPPLLPQPQCSGFVPCVDPNAVPSDFADLGDDIFTDEKDVDITHLDPEVEYEVFYDEYAAHTYYNIVLRRSDFSSASSDTKYLGVVLKPETPIGCCNPI